MLGWDYIHVLWRLCYCRQRILSIQIKVIRMSIQCIICMANTGVE